jgi:uncharacterized protein with von Willebrand factor type A (vWA) domain
MAPAATEHAFLPNALHFARLLRAAGLGATAAQAADFAAALRLVGPEDRETVRAAAQAIFVKRREQMALFARAFDLFWRGPAAANEVNLAPQRGGAAGTSSQIRLALQSTASEMNLALQEEAARDRTAAWSATERLRRADLAGLGEDELRAVLRLAAAGDRQPPLRRTRRRVPDRGGGLLDLRRTLRASLRHGGEPLRLLRRTRKERPRPLVLLCDVSGSMERYARVLLQVAWALRRRGAPRRARVEAFAFATRLTRLTRLLDERSAQRALRAAADAAQDWGGGTRIGATLKVFNYLWARRVLGGGATVVIVSDGCDRGDPALLAAQMARLRRSCRRLLWLNPLLGDPAYAPRVRGMAAALPYVDDFLPAHSLESVEAAWQVIGD